MRYALDGYFLAERPFGAGDTSCPAWPPAHGSLAGSAPDLAWLRNGPGKPKPSEMRGGRIWTDDPLADTNEPPAWTFALMAGDWGSVCAGPAVTARRHADRLLALRRDEMAR